MKWERNYLDKVRPIKTLILFGLVLDPWFTLRFCFLSAYYFLKTRFDGLPWRKSFKTTADLFRSETRLFMDLEKDARELLDKNAAVHTVILGHSHRPMHKIYPDGKQYLNTGTWTKMINLDWQGLGQLFRRTFALVRIEGDKAQCDLRQWVGVHGPHQLFDG
jgi:UDP-2,3-diacylglucosamine pyrophosphatase LpxH